MYNEQFRKVSPIVITTVTITISNNRLLPACHLYKCENVFKSFQKGNCTKSRQVRKSSFFTQHCIKARDSAGFAGYRGLCG